MATFSVESITESGLDATYNAANAGGDTFANTPENRIVLHVKNGDTASHTVTVTPEDSSEDFPGWGTMTKSNVSVAIPAGEDRFIGPFPSNAFGATPAITYDDVSSVTVAVLKTPK